jgi:hypothetical protein
MKKSFADYVQDCINALEKMSPNGLLNGLGELVNPELKSFVKNKLKNEVLTLLRLYREFPIES